MDARTSPSGFIDRGCGLSHCLNLDQQPLARLGQDLSFARLLKKNGTDPSLKAAKATTGRSSINAQCRTRSGQLPGSGNCQEYL